MRRSAHVLLLLFFLGGTLARTLHQITVPHRLCQVHGTIEHGLDTELLARGSAEECQPELSQDEGTHRRPDPAAHEECEVACFTRTENALPLQVQRTSALLLEPNGPHFVRQFLAPRTALYRQAPSRSPPA